MKLGFLLTIANELKRLNPTMVDKAYHHVNREREIRKEEVKNFPAAYVDERSEPKFLFDDADGDALYLRQTDPESTEEIEAITSCRNQVETIIPVRMVARFIKAGIDNQANELMTKFKLDLGEMALTSASQYIKKVFIEVTGAEDNKWNVIDTEWEGLEYNLGRHELLIYVDFDLHVRYIPVAECLGDIFSDLCCEVA